MPHVVPSRRPPDVSVVLGPRGCIANVVIIVREIYEGAPDGVWICDWRRIGRIVDGGRRSSRRRRGRRRGRRCGRRRGRRRGRRCGRRRSRRRRRGQVDRRRRRRLGRSRRRILLRLGDKNTLGHDDDDIGVFEDMRSGEGVVIVVEEGRGGGCIMTELAAK